MVGQIAPSAPGEQAPENISAQITQLKTDVEGLINDGVLEPDDFEELLDDYQTDQASFEDPRYNKILAVFEAIALDETRPDSDPDTFIDGLVRIANEKSREQLVQELAQDIADYRVSFSPRGIDHAIEEGNYEAVLRLLTNPAYYYPGKAELAKHGRESIQSTLKEKPRGMSDKEWEAAKPGLEKELAEKRIPKDAEKRPPEISKEIISKLRSLTSDEWEIVLDHQQAIYDSKLDIDH